MIPYQLIFYIEIGSTVLFTRMCCHRITPSPEYHPRKVCSEFQKSGIHFSSDEG